MNVYSYAVWIVQSTGSRVTILQSGGLRNLTWLTRGRRTFKKRGPTKKMSPNELSMWRTPCKKTMGRSPVSYMDDMYDEPMSNDTMYKRNMAKQIAHVIEIDPDLYTVQDLEKLVDWIRKIE